MENHLRSLVQHMSLAAKRAAERPFYTARASLLHYSLQSGQILDQQYMDSTFSIMVTMSYTSEPHETIAMPVVMTLYETASTLGEELQHALSVNRRICPANVSASIYIGNTHAIQPIIPGGEDIAPLLRLLKARGGIDEISIKLNRT